MKVRYTGAARADLKTIRAYIARDSPENAKRFIARIRTAIARLKSFPESGSVVEEWRQADIRQLIVGNYRIIYYLVGGEVQVQRVFHAARMLPEQPED
jgi:toxin ParE1/3/4